MNKYRENQRITAVQVANARQAARQQRRQRLVDRLDNFLYYGFFNRFAGEWLWLICYSIMSILLALQLDNYIHVNWHLIFVRPTHFACIPSYLQSPLI